MRRTFLGSTTLPVTPLGLGLAALGRPGYINLGHGEDLGYRYGVEEMEAHAHGVLDAAYRSGVRYFDAARSYGRAEAFLRGWLDEQGLKPGDIVIGSKWGYTYTADWRVEADVHEIKDHSLPVFLRQRGETRELLGDFLDLYQIHSATLESGVLEDRSVLEALYNEKQQGTVIGISVSGPEQARTIEKALQVEVNGERLFDSFQVTWNLLEQSAGPILEEAHRIGVGVILKEALANGRLTGKNQARDFQEKIALLQDEAQRLGVSMDALALAAAASRPWADVVLSGAARVEHLHSNLTALEVEWDQQAESILDQVRETPADYWKTRAQLEWQ